MFCVVSGDLNTPQINSRSRSLDFVVEGRRRPAPFAQVARSKCDTNQEKTYYPGKIERDCGDGTYDIVCCDPGWVVNLSAAIACRIITRRWVPTITTEFEERIASQNTRPKRRAVELSCAAITREYVYTVGTHSDRSDGSVSASVSDPRRRSGTWFMFSYFRFCVWLGRFYFWLCFGFRLPGSSDSSSGSSPSALVLTVGDKIESRFFSNHRLRELAVTTPGACAA